VLAYTTVQRTREIGIRIALGSTRLAISGLVAKEMLRLGAIGVLVASSTSSATFSKSHPFHLASVATGW
jgi:ABC-type antimicrobial peptide transport system permease subunit